jgi:hypothetical protein
MEAWWKQNPKSQEVLRMLDEKVKAQLPRCSCRPEIHTMSQGRDTNQ